MLPIKKALLIFIALGFSCCTYGQLLSPGMAVVTQGAEASQPNDFVIKIVDIRNHSSAPVSNNWNPNFITPASTILNEWKAVRLGNVFAIAIDDSANFYSIASSMYGLQFFSSQRFGTAGSAGIYKFNAADGKVYDLVTTDNNPFYRNIPFKIPNTGIPSLGDICFDNLHRQLFVSNFEDGKIYRIATNGAIKSVFDPFDADDNQRGIAPDRERVYGLGYYQRAAGNSQLFFCRWGIDSLNPNQIYSISLNLQTGDFEGSPQLEFNIPFTLDYSNPVSDMAFSGDSLLVLAERGHPHHCRQLTYRKNGTWQLEKINQLGAYYAVGPDEHYNCAGGIDLGYESSSGDLNNTVSCQSMIWATGNAIKYDGYNPDNSSDYIYGMTGYAVTGNSPYASDPAYYFTHSVYVDFNNNITDAPKGYLGDVEIYRPYCPSVEPPVIEPEDCFLINVITPNGDHKNDFLNFKCNLANLQLNVYNRWGSLMYENANYKNDWSPVSLTDGVYYYILKIPEHKTIHGFFELIK